MATEDEELVAAWQAAKAKRDAAIEAAVLSDGHIDIEAVAVAKAEWAEAKAALVAKG